jgi:hypothetical protein
VVAHGQGERKRNTSAVAAASADPERPWAAPRGGPVDRRPDPAYDERAVAQVRPDHPEALEPFGAERLLTPDVLALPLAAAVLGAVVLADHAVLGTHHRPGAARPSP